MPYIEYLSFIHFIKNVKVKRGEMGLGNDTYIIGQMKASIYKSTSIVPKSNIMDWKLGL